MHAPIGTFSVRKYLARWGVTPQKPIRRAYEQSPQAVKAWLDDEYQVTVSGSRQANRITAQVVGDGEMVNGRSYCIFTGSSHRVAFPAYLYYRRESGDWVSRRNSCIEEPIDMTDALWVETTWDVPCQDEGRFYRTDLQLKFPMNDPVSQFSRAGEDWIGVVSATGEVRVTATWAVWKSEMAVIVMKPNGGRCSRQ